MRSYELRQRLVAAREASQLTFAQLAIWFAKDYHTVRSWYMRKSTPNLDRQDIERRLEILEYALSRRYLPFSPQTKQSARAISLRGIYSDAEFGYRSNISAGHTAA